MLFKRINEKLIVVQHILYILIVPDVSVRYKNFLTLS